jgi:hypothetical protein
VLSWALEEGRVTDRGLRYRTLRDLARLTLRLGRPE